MNLKEKVVIVSGGAGAIGESIAKVLLKSSVKVIVFDIKKSDFIKNTSEVFFVKCDLNSEDDINKAVNEVIGNFGRIDALVNNAGILHSEPLINLVSEKKRHSKVTFKKVIDINLIAPFVLTSYVTEHMITNRIKGVIVNISSISAKGNAGQTAYSASKAGLEAMSIVWAKELGTFGIRSVSIAPGFFDTESTYLAVSPSVIEYIKKSTPLRRLGKVEEIANTVKFIIENDFLNGITIDLNGGLTI